jgi:hypothetical protein
MKLLLDENLPHRLRPLLVGHEVFTVAYMQWAGIENGALLALAAANGFDALITKDNGMPYERRITCVLDRRSRGAVQRIGRHQALASITARPASNSDPEVCVAYFTPLGDERLRKPDWLKRLSCIRNLGRRVGDIGTERRGWEVQP